MLYTMGKNLEVLPFSWLKKQDIVLFSRSYGLKLIYIILELNKLVGTQVGAI